MTTIGVKYHDEDIHDIIQKPMSPTVKSPRYKSKRESAIALAANEKKKYNGHQTFGLAHYEPPEAKNFLRKRKPRNPSIQAELIKRNDFKCTIDCKSSPIPKRSFESRKQEKKNYIKENIKKTAALKPKVPVPRRVETPRGTTKDLAHLLQMIKIRESENFAKLPKYLSERKKREEKERKKQELERKALAEYREKMGIGSMGMGENVYMIDNETRQKILDGLKENWNELSKHFLKLPVMLDTWPKIKRKICLEKEIDQLEKDIRLVESHPYIYLERQGGYFGQEEKEGSQSKLKEQETEAEVQKEKAKEEEEAEQEEEEKKTELDENADEYGEEKKDEDKEINILNY